MFWDVITEVVDTATLKQVFSHAYESCVPFSIPASDFSYTLLNYKDILFLVPRRGKTRLFCFFC